MTARARYDGNADWYDEKVAWSSAAATPLIVRLAGDGRGRCLDLGCGTGVQLPALAASGWSVVGVDVSGDQLRVARHRAGSAGSALVQGDVGQLPFADGAFDLVLSAFTLSDVDDFGALAKEGRRVLRPAGRFLSVGLHPCFTGPFAEQPRADGARVVHPGYARAGWRTGGPGTVVGGLTDRVGFHHRPLADLLNSVLDADLRLLHVEEGGNAALPEWLALVALR
jgi:SAM-dependent methyltransferase